MALVRRFLLNPGFNYIKIRHRANKDFNTIGVVEKINEKLNIAKISFIDIDGKKSKYWFHLFTGSVVTLPKKGEKWAKDVSKDSKKAYMLSLAPVYQYDIDPRMDQNYVSQKSEKNTESNEEDPDSNKNESVKKIE